MRFNKENEVRVPEWCSYFNKTEYSAFIDAVDKNLKKLNVDYEISGGVVHAKKNDLDINDLGLSNLGQICHQNQLQDYEEIIENHLNSLIKSNQFDKEFKKIVHDFEKVKQYIGVRLYNYDYVSYIGSESVIIKKFAGDIYAMLVFDFPTSIVNIKPDQIIPWHKTIDELFETGIQNIRESYPPEISQAKLGDAIVWAAEAEHFYSPNILFDLGNTPEFIGSKGSLVGIPNRHIALIYPIKNSAKEAISAINNFIVAIYNMYEDGRGSISNNLLWFVNNRFIHLPYEVKDNKLEFYPPEEFVDLLNSLE